MLGDSMTQEATEGGTRAIIEGSEAIQAILRREGYPNPYETLKQLTRTNQQVTAETIAQFIDTLQVSSEVKAELKAITPSSYTGL